MENNANGHMPMYAPAVAYVNPSKKHFNKVALIDADKLKHLCAYDMHTILKKGDSRTPEKLTAFIEDRLKGIFSQFSAAAYIFCFSGKSFDTFRSKIAICKEYKGSRKVDATFYEGKIEDMATVVQYVQNLYPTLIFSDLEADDLLCFLQNTYTFIYSNDKDLKQIPGYHFNETKMDLEEISQEDAFRNLSYQLLVGDSTDCIPGIPKVGDATALKIIDSVPLKQLPFTILYEYMSRCGGITKGIDAFVETWNLVKLRENRGDHFKEKYQRAFQLRDACIGLIK